MNVAPPPDVVRARSAATAPERRAMPVQRFVPPASPSKAPSPRAAVRAQRLRSLLEGGGAARDKVGAFEDEEIDGRDPGGAPRGRFDGLAPRGRAQGGRAAPREAGAGLIVVYL